MPFSKRTAFYITAVFIILALVSCKAGVSSDNLSEASPPPGSVQQVYYNGAYGLRVEVPTGWEVAAIIPANMTASPEESDDFAGLETIPCEDSGSIIQMIELWSMEDSSDPEHAGLMVYVEFYEGLDEDAYLSAFEETYSGEFNGYRSVLVSRGTALFEGLTFNMFKFETTLPEGDQTYYEEYYVRKVADGEFLVICTNYWAENETSYNDSRLALDAVSFID